MRNLRRLRLALLCLPLVALLVLPAPAAPAVHMPEEADFSGGVTSIVPPLPQVVEQMRKEGRPLPDLSQYKVSPSPVRPRPLQGNVNLLAILVDFSGSPGTVTNLTLFNDLVFKAPVAGRGSVRDYYDEVTRGTVTLVTVNLPSTTGWQHASQTMAYYANGWGGMAYWAYPQNSAGYVVEALALVDPLLDFSNYDNDGDGQVDTLLVIHAGTGAEWSGNSSNHIWSHAALISTMGGSPPTLDGVLVDNYVTAPEYWEPSMVGPGATDLTVGVACHEIAHGLFGLPDLYDVDMSSNGVGQWALMSYGDWNGPGKWNSFYGFAVTDGSSPAWPTAWTRVLLGWDTATLYLGPIDNVCLAPAETTANAVVRFKTAGLYSQEYFLAENRRRVTNSYDEYIPGDGMLIWHVDEAFWGVYGGPDNDSECTTTPHCSGSCATTHYMVSLEQADRQDHLENGANRGDAGDPFPGSSNNTSWRSYELNPVNPESNSWYYAGCSRPSCIDLTGIGTSGNNVCFSLQQAACATAEADLGDAPASTNNHGNLPMTAYPLPYVQASFPTVFQGPPPAVGQGPRHHLTLIDSLLGTLSTVELNADWPPDQDGMTNISPTIDAADMDSLIYAGDDGLGLPVPIAHCSGSTVPFTLSVFLPGAFSPMPRYVNLWFDWNRDGDWGDTLTCPGGPPAPEWSWQDVVLVLPPGVYPFTGFPAITGKVSVSEGSLFETWARLSVAEMPAPAPYDGRGPALGYDHGETEDYYLVLSPTLQMAPPSPPPSPGLQVTYNIQYGGVMGSNVLAKGVVISDVLSQGIEFLFSTPPPDLWNPATRTAHWTTDLDPTAPGTIQMTVLVTGMPGDTVTNTAHLLWGGQLWKRAGVTSQLPSCGPGDPTADFYWSQPACADGTVQFTNLSAGSPPLSFAWDLDSDGDVDSTAQDPTWVYGDAGSYLVTLTATNNCGSDQDSDTVTVLQGLNGLSIAGPISLLVGEVGTYTAVPDPADATNPQYAWDNGLVGSSTSYSWGTAGLYTIAVTGSNDCGSVAATLDVLVTSECISLTGVTVSGPGSLAVGQEGTYLAVVEPLTATNPAYLWSSGDTAASVVYSWTVPGNYTVAVTVTNCLNVTVSDSMVVVVAEGYKIYLPLVAK